MSDQQHDPERNDCGGGNIYEKHETNVPNELYKQLLKPTSIRGGGGGDSEEGQQQKRKLIDILNDDNYDSAEDKDFSPNFSDSESSESDEKLTSTIGSRLRNRNNIKSGLSLSSLSSPSSQPKPSHSSSNNNDINTAAAATSPMNSDEKQITSSSHNGQQIVKQEASTPSQNTDQLKIKQENNAQDKQMALVPQQQLIAQNQDNHHSGAVPIMERKEAQKRILQNLESLCDHYSQDIHFACVPSAPTTTTNKNRIDLSGSFLRSDDVSSLDFFDLNEKGEITLQPRPPIFPEELSNGMKEHPLRWWGVEDPAVADGRFKTVPTKPDPAASFPGDDRGRQIDHRRGGGEYNNNGHDRKYGPPPPGGPPPHYDRQRGPDRRRDRR